jgi:protein disulfide-isomerase A6
MKPAWDQLAETFADSKTAIIVDVDCTKDDNKDLCSKYGVRGYPTIKYFTEGTDPMGDKYEGGRDFDSLKAFADENLGPSCSYNNLELCNDEQKAEIEKVAAMSQEDRAAKIKELDGKSEAAEKKFKAEVEKLQKTYEKLSKNKDDAIAALGPELRVLRSVDGAMKKAAKDEL